MSVDIWYEKHRPQTLDQYVWQNIDQRKKVEEWIASGALPHLLFHGTPGTGKCLDGSEKIRIKINRLESEIKIADLFSFVEKNLNCNFEYDQQVILPDNLIEIESPNGYVPVRGLIKKKHILASYIIEDNIVLKCSTQHLIFQNGEVSKISEANCVDTINGTKNILGVDIIGENDVYDVCLDFPHQYTTPNGIIHHNTSLAKLLLKELNIPNGDILTINASRERKMEDIRSKSAAFVGTWALNESGIKYIILDEADRLPPLVQDMLRNDMEQFASVCRFILTCNHSERIIPALHSRLQDFRFEVLDRGDFMARVGEILLNENVEFEVESLLEHVNRTYPDLRKCIASIQKNVIGGKLKVPSADDSAVKDYLIEMVELFKNGKVKAARELLVKSATIEDFPDIYRFMFNNLQFWSKSDDGQDEALLIINKAQARHHTVADPEINLAACVVELGRIS